jgi:hypothetical protein
MHNDLSAAPEEWAAVHVPEFAQRYQVSTHGRVRNLESRKLLGGWPHGHSKIPKITLNWQGLHRDFFLKELVWGAFREPAASYDIREIDGDIRNVRLDNLAVRGAAVSVGGYSTRRYVRTVGEFWDEFLEREAPTLFAIWQAREVKA